MKLINRAVIRLRRKPQPWLGMNASLLLRRDSAPKTLSAKDGSANALWRIIKVPWACPRGSIFFTLLLAIALSAGQEAALAEGATLSGKVSFEGEAPAPKPINFGAEKQCAVAHADKLPITEDLVVNPNHTVKWALVYVKEGVTGQYTAPEQAVTIDQQGCVFSPHATAVMAGQKVVFKNGDPVLHNVRSASKINKAFNIAQPIQGMTTTKTFAQPEVGMQLRCDVHFWMAAYLHVLSHPFFAITGDDGSFAIKGLPAGTYTLELWHETLGTQSQTVTVGAGESKEVGFVLKKA